jgi:hypothetical protein
MEEELTLKEFVAYMFYTLERQGSEMLPLWLCLRKDLQEKSLKKVDRLFKKWKRQELEALKSRSQLTKREADVCLAGDCEKPAVMAGLCEDHSF